MWPISKSVQLIETYTTLPNSRQKKLMGVGGQRFENSRMNKESPQRANTMNVGIHPAWIALIRHCQAMGHGEIERIKIQDGVPVLIEKSVEKIKLT